MKTTVADVITIGGALTARQMQQRDAAEHDMGTGLDMFWRGAAVIAAGKLWRSTHKSLALYLRDHLQGSRQRAHQVAKHLTIVVAMADGDAEEMSTIVDILPEAATREVADLEPEKAAEIVKTVAKNNGKVTASAVKAARDESDAPPKRKISGKQELGKCPACAGGKWNKSPDGPVCAKCSHPHGEPAGEVEDRRIAAQRQKLCKTIEATMREVDDMNLLLPRSCCGAAITHCRELLALSKAWK